MKGDLKKVPYSIVNRMIKNQISQGNPGNLSVFENDIKASTSMGGFNWANTKEGSNFWSSVIDFLNFEVYYEMYPEEKLKEKVKKRPLKYNKGDIILFGNLKYKVSADFCEFLKKKGSNAVVFFMYNIDKLKLQKRVLGYKNGGNFPICNSMEDLNKFIVAIQREIEIFEIERQIEKQVETVILGKSRQKLEYEKVYKNIIVTDLEYLNETKPHSRFILDMDSDSQPMNGGLSKANRIGYFTRDEKTGKITPIEKIVLKTYNKVSKLKKKEFNKLIVNKIKII